MLYLKLVQFGEYLAIYFIDGLVLYNSHSMHLWLWVNPLSAKEQNIQG